MIDPKDLKAGDVVWCGTLWGWPSSDCVRRLEVVSVTAKQLRTERGAVSLSEVGPLFATEAEARAWRRDGELRRVRQCVDTCRSTLARAEADLAKLEALVAAEAAKEPTCSA